VSACAATRPREFAQATNAPRKVSEKEAPVRVLSRRLEYRLDERGNWKETFSHRYEILNRAGTETWAGTGTQWSPWYMTPPALTASVLDPDGTRRILDPKTLVDSAAYPDLPDVYSDSRVLRGPLPGVRVGSVVEESIVRETKQPFFVGGSEFDVAFQSHVPQDKVELVVDLPASLPFHFEVLGADRITFAGGPYAAIEPIPADAPSDVPPWPTVAFSTAESWQQVARAYAAMVESKLGNTDLKSMAGRLVKPDDSRRDKAAKLLAEVKRRVRYAAVEFGQAAIIPAIPKVTLERAYGDCKDQSLLLVGLLRAAGLDAKLALLRAGGGNDVRAKLPALDVFNHAIVYIEGDEPIWIDPTSDYARPNELPESDQGRLSLLVDPATTDLTLTPVSTSDQNTYVEHRQIRLPEHGAASVHETTVVTGVLEHSLRASFDGSKEALQKTLTDYVKRIYVAEKLDSRAIRNCTRWPASISRRARSRRHARSCRSCSSSTPSRAAPPGTSWAAWPKPTACAKPRRMPTRA